MDDGLMSGFLRRIFYKTFDLDWSGDGAVKRVNIGRVYILPRPAGVRVSRRRMRSLPRQHSQVLGAHGQAQGGQSRALGVTSRSFSLYVRRGMDLLLLFTIYHFYLPHGRLYVQLRP